MALNAIVRTNITAVNAHRQLSGAGLTQTKAAQKLASGKRINTAADDVAGMGIVEKMRAQITGLDRASLNAQDAMSLVQTAEGALAGINDMLIRVRELVVQAANDTNVHDLNDLMRSDRKSIQDEIDQIMFEINNVAYRTEFNTRTLLNGSLHPEGVVHGTHQWVDVVQTNAPARITTLDQFLRFPANNPYEGSFSDLLTRIGANLETKTADEWIAVHASANWDGLEQALDVAMGVDPVFAGQQALVEVSGNGGRWEELQVSAGLSFRSARELLDAFVQGLHNPNVLRPGDIAWNAPQEHFESWEDFISGPPNGANPLLTASTFARAMSTSGGQTIYEALRQEGFAGLGSESTFSDVRNIFSRMDSVPAGGWGGGLTSLSPSLTGWLATRFPDVVGSDQSAVVAQNRIQGLEAQIRDVLFQYNVDENFTTVNRDDALAQLRSDLEEARRDLNEAAAEARWEMFVARYLTADTELVEHQVWVPNEAERERGIALWFQTGANSGQGITVGIRSMTTRSLGEPIGDLMDMVDVENVSGRPISDQIDYLDHALTRVNRQRAQLGAVHNRLEFTMYGLDISSENLTASMSRIRDADMAKAMMQFYSANVLTQAATAMIAQANQSPQMVLQLIESS